MRTVATKLLLAYAYAAVCGLAVFNYSRAGLHPVTLGYIAAVVGLPLVWFAGSGLAGFAGRQLWARLAELIAEGQLLAAERRLAQQKAAERRSVAERRRDPQMRPVPNSQTEDLSLD